MSNAIKIKIAQDTYLRRIDNEIDEIARGIAYLANTHPSGKWNKGNVEREMRHWGQAINEQMSSTNILTFLKRQMAHHSNFWMKLYSERGMMNLAEATITLLREEGDNFATFLVLETGTGDEEAERTLFRMRLIAYKKIWEVLSVKVFGYITFCDITQPV